MAFRSRTGSGHELILDSKPEAGGSNLGPRPTELLLSALGGCTAMDVISILRKKRQQVSKYEVRVTAQQRDEQPAIFTSMVVEHVVHGRDVDAKAVQRAAELSAEKYCSVGAMLSAAAPIEHRYTVIDDLTGEETKGVLAEHQPVIS